MTQEAIRNTIASYDKHKTKLASNLQHYPKFVALSLKSLSIIRTKSSTCID